MTAIAAQGIGGWLERKERLSATVDRDPALAGALENVRRWQAMRLAASYADLRSDPRYAAAMRNCGAPSV